MTAVAVDRPGRPHVAHTRRVSTLGIILIGLWIVLALLLVWALAHSITGDRLATFGGRFFSGFRTTIELVVLSVLIGAVISVPVAAGRLSRNRIIGTLAYCYSYFFRGSPLIAQLFLIYYGAGEFAGPLKSIGLWWFFRDAFNCAVLSFALNTAAYQSEILSGSIRNIPHGQREAATALGLHRWVIIWKIVLPQALVVALRPYGNEVVLMIKASAVAAIVTVLDLMGQTRFIFSKTYDLSFYLWAALFYFVLVELLGRAINAIERRITRHHIR
ncbi:MAG TPA: ABC transporter permease [Bauldia sp.]|nr:ABC transporter permease [Bauldia sp.]